MEELMFHGNYIDGSPEVTADNWNGGIQLEDLSVGTNQRIFRINQTDQNHSQCQSLQ